ncbi:MAG: hypothetical protein ACKV1O_03470 [Saprospiraceae bacterium]
MDKENYIRVDGNGNLVLQDVSGSTINMNSTEAIENAIRSANQPYLDGLQEQISEQKGLFLKLNADLVNTLESLIAKQQTVLTNANLGNIFGVQGGVQLGNNTFNYTNSDDLILAIQAYLDNRGLDQHYRALFSEWVTTLRKPEGVQRISEIRYKFVGEVAQLKKIQTQKNEKLKIWLDRSGQKTDYTECIKSFCKKEQIGAFVFCVVGNSDTDVIEDATEMLKLLHFNKLMQQGENSEIVKEKRVYDSFWIKTEADASNAYETIMRDVLNLNIFSERDDFVNLLNTEYQNKHIVARCKVRDWEEAGLSAFFDVWLREIKRENKYPFVLLFEFSDTDFERLKRLIETRFSDALVALLPKLAKVTDKDLDEFYGGELRLENTIRYDEIFDRTSLTARDTPLFYRDAINKLKLKH